MRIGDVAEADAEAHGLGGRERELQGRAKFEPRAQVAVSARQYDARRESRSQPQTTGKRDLDGHARVEKSGSTRGGEQTGDRTEHGPAPWRAQLPLDFQRARDLLPQAALNRPERGPHRVPASRPPSEEGPRQ